MRTLLVGVALVVTTGTSASGVGEEKFDAKKLVGEWEPKVKKEGRLATIEFTKDGKVKITSSEMGKESKWEGTYEADGDKLITVLKVVGGDKARGFLHRHQADGHRTDLQG